MIGTDDLVDALAKLDRRSRRAAVDAAQAKRQRFIRDVVRRIRAEIVPLCSDAKAARLIDDAARSRQIGFRDQPDLRIEIERQLVLALGSLHDLPGSERIRQLLRI